MPPMRGTAVRRRGFVVLVVGDLRERLAPIDRPPTEHSLGERRGGDGGRIVLLESERHTVDPDVLPSVIGPLSRGSL